MNASYESNGLRTLALVCAVTVTLALACEARTPLDSQRDASSPNSQTTMTASDAALHPTTTTTTVDAATGATVADAAAEAAPAALTPAQMQQALAETMMRWNQVADGTATSLDFHWLALDQFPHPTYKGGTAEGYGEFSTVLLAFFQRDDNFAFLARNHLFVTRLRYVFPSGQVGLDTSFQELALYFSSSAAFGNISAATRAGLADVVVRMKLAL